MSPLSRLIREHGLVLSTACVYSFFGLLFLVISAGNPGSDFWVRIAVGRLIVEEQIIPRHDPYSFTVPGRDWVDHEWILEAAMYVLNQLNYELLAVVAVIIGLIPFAMMHRLAAKTARNDWLLLALVAFAIFASWRNFGVRPQLVNAVFFVALIWLIEHHRRTGGRRIWAVVPLMFVWANLHGGFIIGVAVLLAWLAVCVYEQRSRQLALAIVVSGSVITLLNAYGPGIYVYTLSASLGDNVDRANIDEWRTPDFHDPLNLPTLFAVIAMSWFGARTRDPWRQALALGTLAAGLVSARFMPFFALSLIFVAAPQLPQLRLPRAAAELVLPLLFTFSLSLLAIAAVATATADPPTTRVPAASLDFLQATDPGSRAFVDMGGASYFTYRDERVFVDTRTHQVFPEEILRDYTTVVETEGDWEAVLERWEIEYVVIPRKHDLADSLEAEDWLLVFEEDTESVWRRPSSSSSGTRPY